MLPQKNNTADAHHNRLASKVRQISTSPEALLAAAEAAVADLQGEFEKWLPEDIATMKLLAAAIIAAPDGAERERETLARAAHTTKGQGTTFGYELITAIAGSLNHYLLTMPRARQRGNVILAHIEAMGAVAKNRMTGDGGAMGHALIAALTSAIGQKT